MKLRPCSSATFKHTWSWVKNKVTRTETLHTIHLVQRGVYRCATCKAAKFGPARVQNEQPLQVAQP